MALRAFPRVWVLSFANSGNFGDRLGVHLLHSVLPPHAVVRHISFNPWDAPADETPDLLIVGIGNSVFQPLLTDELFRLVERTPKAIGIFGTQYHEMMPMKGLGQLLGDLDVWFARSREDLTRYGHLAHDARHLGDWLIDAFPMAEPRKGEILRLPSEALGQQAALDRYIMMIQHHARVYSPRLHPLLCALTSAREVAYSEQHALVGDRRLPSGKFSALLHDIFGQSYPPGQPFLVDRIAVANYKAQVRRNIEGLRDTIGSMLAIPVDEEATASASR